MLSVSRAILGLWMRALKAQDSGRPANRRAVRLLTTAGRTAASAGPSAPQGSAVRVTIFMPRANVSDMGKIWTCHEYPSSAISAGMWSAWKYLETLNPAREIVCRDFNPSQSRSRLVGRSGSQSGIASGHL